MKKNNKLMRASGILLVLTMATSCFVGGTFAKYTTATSGTDMAHVAKWGVTLEQVTSGGAYGDQAFETTYEVEGGDSILGWDNDSFTVTVQGTLENDNNDKDVVAPGTSGQWDGIAFKMSGSEVAVQLTTEATITLIGWGEDEDFYCPLIFTVGDPETEGNKIYGLDYGSAEALQSALEEKINENGTHAHAPGNYSTSYVSASNKDGNDYGVGYFAWEWPFDGENNLKEDGTGTPLQTDAKDTELGNADNSPTISFDMDITATQID